MAIDSKFSTWGGKSGKKRVLTAESPISLTTHANMADLPLMTVTLAGVEGSMYGSGVGSGVVVPKAPAAP